MTAQVLAMWYLKGIIPFILISLGIMRGYAKRKFQGDEMFLMVVGAFIWPFVVALIAFGLVIQFMCFIVNVGKEDDDEQQ